MTEDPLRRIRHDIRGRLNALRLCVAVLETPLESEEVQEFIADILQTCDSLADLVDELLLITPASGDE